MTRILLVDGDMLVHRSTVAVEKDTRFLDRYHILFSDADSAWNVLEETLGELQNIAETDEVLFTFSDPDANFRKEFTGGEYKSNRAGSRKPLAYWETRKRCEDTFASLMVPTLEADDVMGISMTGDCPVGEFVLWSLDKDLKQIPGLHIADAEVIERKIEDCDLFFYQQVLAGDVTDGYTGCPGVGNETAKKFLENNLKLVPEKHVLTRGPRKGSTEIRWVEAEAENHWETVLSLYHKAELTEEDAVHNARMARILRTEDYKNGKVIPWEPK